METELRSWKESWFINFLTIFLFLSMLGAVKPVIFNGGSSLAKFFAKSQQLELVNETEIEDFMESSLFGDSIADEATISKVQYSEKDLTESTEFIFKMDYWIAVFVLLSSFLLLIPKIRESRFYHVLIPVTIWIFCLALGATLNGGKKFSDLSILAHGTRWGLPLVLWMALTFKSIEFKLNFSRTIIATVCFCAGATFAVHGWEALRLNPPFQDLIFNFGALIGWSVTPEQTQIILKSVGCMDLLLAASLIFIRHPKILLWMAIWGFITAFSRPLTLGLEAWPEFAMRLANGALPLSLFLIYQTQTEKQSCVNEKKTNKMEVVYE